MKKFTIIALVLVVAFGLCACRMGSNNETTPTTDTATTPQPTDPTAPSATDPTIIDPTITDPTIEPNVPDPSVDDEHLVDPTDGAEGTPNIRGWMS